MSLVHDEQTKLLANALNTAATSSFTIGVLAPIAAAIYAPSGAAVSVRVVALAAAVWLRLRLPYMDWHGACCGDCVHD